MRAETGEAELNPDLIGIQRAIPSAGRHSCMREEVGCRRKREEEGDSIHQQKIKSRTSLSLPLPVLFKVESSVFAVVVDDVIMSEKNSSIIILINNTNMSAYNTDFLFFVLNLTVVVVVSSE